MLLRTKMGSTCKITDDSVSGTSEVITFSPRENVSPNVSNYGPEPSGIREGTANEIAANASRRTKTLYKETKDMTYVSIPVPN